MPSLLSSLKEEVRHLMSQAENTLEKKVMADGLDIAPLIDKLEDVLCDGLHRGVHLWSWVVTLERHDHDMEYAWAYDKVQKIKNQSYPSERVLGRRWLRASLNDQTLTAAIALLMEVDDAHVMAYFQKMAIITSPTLFQQLLDIVMPIGGCSLADRASTDSKIMSDPYFIFNLPLIVPSEHTLPADLSWEQDPTPVIETTRTVVVNGISVDTSDIKKTVRRRITPKTSPKHQYAKIAAGDAKDENDIKKRKTKKRVAAGTIDSTSSFDSLPPGVDVSVDSDLIAQPSLSEKEKIRRELEEWRRQRAVDKKVKPDINPQIQPPTSTSPSECSMSPVSIIQSDEFNLSSHMLKMVQGRERSIERDPYVRHLLSVNSSLEDQVTQLLRQNNDFISRIHTAHRLLDSRSVQQISNNVTDVSKVRFTLVHSETNLRISISICGSRLVLTRTGAPCAFRLEEGRLVDDNTSQCVVPGPYQGSDRTLSFSDDLSSVNTEWIFMDNRLEENITGTCVHIYGGKIAWTQPEYKGQEQLLVLHKSRDDPKRLEFIKEYLGNHSAICGGIDDDISDLIISQPTANSSKSASPMATSDKLDPTLLLSSLTSADILARQSQGSFNKLPGTPPPNSSYSKQPPSGSTSRNSSFSVSAPSTVFEGDDDHQKHRIKLITDIKEKHSDYSEKERRIERQGKKCKGCLRTLKKTWSPIYFSWRYDTVRFCWYMGKYYCNGCHDDSLLITVPARVLFSWDVKPRPVCRDAHEYLLSLWDKPIVCVSAINPVLFDKVEPLRQARDLRIQLSVINKTTSTCDDFKNYLADHPVLIPENMAYAVQGTELYSFSDLLAFNESQPSLSDAPVSACLLVKTLETMRNKMIEHIVQNCDSCYENAAMNCETCATEGIEQAKIFEFEVQKVQTCRKCGRVYHRVCYQISQCGHCT